MTTEHQREQQERRRIIREQASTNLDHAQAEANIDLGRFGSLGSPTVIGSKPAVATAYPTASAAHQVELPAEEPLGYAIDQVEPLEPSHSPTQGSLPSSASDDAPSPNTPLLSPDVEQRDADLPKATSTFVRHA